MHYLTVCNGKQKNFEHCYLISYIKILIQNGAANQETTSYYDLPCDKKTLRLQASFMNHHPNTSQKVMNILLRIDECMKCNANHSKQSNLIVKILYGT